MQRDNSEYWWLLKPMLILFAISGVGLLLAYLLRFQLLLLLLPNGIFVQTKGVVDVNAITINWSYKGDTAVVFNNQVSDNLRFSGKGKNVFDVYYEGVYQTSFEHNKMTEYATHDYFFVIDGDSDNVYFDLKISGPEAQY